MINNRYRLAWVACAYGLLLSLQGCNSRQAVTTTLPELLSNPECSSSCWDGIEPEVTRGDELTNYLEENNIEYTTISGADGEFFDWSVSDSVLSRNGEVIMIDVGLYLPTDTVGYITVGHINLCVSTVVRHFGLPLAVVHRSDSGYWLAYPSNSLVFNADDELQQVSSFSIRSQEVINEDYVARANPPIPQDGSTIENLISEDCADQFSR
jgi:hypothetical protein